MLSKQTPGLVFRSAELEFILIGPRNTSFEQAPKYCLEKYLLKNTSLNYGVYEISHKHPVDIVSHEMQSFLTVIKLCIE